MSKGVKKLVKQLQEQSGIKGSTYRGKTLFVFDNDVNVYISDKGVVKIGIMTDNLIDVRLAMNTPIKKYVKAIVEFANNFDEDSYANLLAKTNKYMLTYYKQYYIFPKGDTIHVHHLTGVGSYPFKNVLLENRISLKRLMEMIGEA